MDDLKFFNPDDFRRWMKKQDDECSAEGNSVVGAFAEARYCGKRIARNITLESGRAGKVVREFVTSGGVVKEVDGEEYLIEVESGSFYIHKRNVRIG